MDFSDDKEKLLEKLLARKGYIVDEKKTERTSVRAGQLERFMNVANSSGYSRNVKANSGNTGSTVTRTLTNVKVFQEGYKEDSKVVFVGNVMSPEILFAMNIVPFNVEVLSAFFATNGTANRFLDIGEKNYISRDTCSVVRCVIGAAIDDCLPFPDFIAFASYPCDAASRMFYALSDHYKKPWFLLDIPYRNNDKSVIYLAGRIREMKKKIEETLGIKTDDDKLATAVEYSKECLKYYEKMINLCQKHKLSMSVVKTATDSMSYFGLIGSKEIIEAIRLNYEEVLERVKGFGNFANTGSDNRPVVTWRGLMPYYDNEIINYFENECGISIIPEMLTVDVDVSDLIGTDDIYHFLAKKLLILSGSGSMTDSLQSRNWDIHEEYGIDGAVLFNQWGCRHTLSCGQIHRDSLSKRNFSVLEIDGDFVDSRNYSFSQTKVRIDAFAELLKRRKEDDYHRN